MYTLPEAELVAELALVPRRDLEDAGEGVGVAAVGPLGAVHLHPAVEHAHARARRVPVCPVHVVHVEHDGRLAGPRRRLLGPPRQQRHARREHRADAARLLRRSSYFYFLFHYSHYHLIILFKS